MTRSRNPCASLALACCVVRLFVAPLGAAGQVAQNPIVSVTVTAPSTQILRGDALQLTVRGRFGDGTERDVTADPATLYTALPEELATIGPGGIVRALSPGQVTIVVSHEPMDQLPASTSIDLVVRVPDDRDGDGLSDAYEIQNGLDPDDPADGAADPDQDGLTNLQESVLGTDPHQADSDGDGSPDGLEVALETNPLDPTSPPPAPRAPRLDQNCTASIQNRAVQVNEDGTFAVPNVPVDLGFYRVRAICKQPDGTSVVGQSAFFLLQSGGVETDIQNIEIVFGTVDPIPVSLQVAALKNIFNARGETVQLAVIGTLPNDTTKDLSGRARGTSYATSNAGIASVSADGLVTAVGRGQVVISARNEGVLGSVVLNVAVPNDADNDAMTDEFERANGLNPNDPNDAGQDPDNDGLTNLQEFQLGSNPRSGDTDGDGLSDGDEVRRGTNPLVADTDGDGLTDAQEIALRTNPSLADTDGDGIADGLEVRLGIDPLVPTATTTVQGRVVDVTGAAVDGASALVLGGLFTGQTTVTGVFRIPSVPATLGPLVALARIVRNNQLLDGLSEAVAAVADGITDVHTIQVAVSSGVVSGLITDPQNRPVVGAQVTLAMGLDTRAATSDLTGRYRIANVQTGAVTLTAIDPQTALRGRIAGVVPQDQPLTLDLRLGAFGNIAGTVFQRDTTTPVGPGVSVSLSGSTVASTQTDPNGRYAFEFVALSGFTIEASDNTGNRGRTSGSLTFTGQTAVADVAFLARGNVTGLIQDGAANPVANATVTLGDGSIFGTTRTINSDATGRYSFFDIFIGPVLVTARSPLTGLGGQVGGTLQNEGQTIDLNVTLAASGTLTGRVFRAGTTPTPLANARVQLSNGLVSTGDAQGNYRFDFVPTGGQGITAIDPATGDRGDGSAIINANQTTTANITLNGLAPVTAIVRDGADQLVEGARVNISAGFGSNQQGLTAADGSITFPRVFVGGYSLSAFNPATQLAGSATGTAVLGATTTTTVRLQAWGTILGGVFAPDNATPASNVTVQLSGPVFRRVTNPPGGAFRFDVLPTGTYRIDVNDQFGNLRAFATGIVLDHQGQEEARRLLMIGVGTVTGLVNAPDGTPASNVSVFISGGRSTQSLTDIVGRYAVPGVPIGGFSVTASRRSGNQQLFGTAQGQITNDGEVVTADITLSASLVPTTTTLHDANNFEFSLRENGSIQDGTRQFFGGDFGSSRGGALLDVIVGGNTTRFTGQSFGTSENDGRQIGIAQTGIGPLDVTRKIFVPLTGYFARYLELFRNTSNAPVTFDVRLTSYSRYISKLQNGFRFNREPRVISTSSGDAILDIGEDADDWLVLDDDENLDPFVTDSLPSVAHVFGGPAALKHADAASFNLQSAFGQLTNEWRNLTLQPGETMALMHFVSQETTREAAQAAATRLVQAPPEALANGTLADLVAGAQQLQSLTQLLAEQAQGLEDAFQGASNTFVATNGAIQSLAAEVNTQLASLQNLGVSSPTVAQVRSAAAAASDLAGRVRQAVIVAPNTPYCVVGSGSCPSVKSLADAAPGLFRNFVNTASSSATRADAARATALNLQELSLVQNFLLPLAGGSNVPPLPSLNGTITGRVLAGDLTPQPAAPVSFHSNHSLFNRTFSFATDGSGKYRVLSSLTDGGSLPVPVDGFTLRAIHPQTGLRSPEISAAFPDGFDSATSDVVFTNSGQLAGVVRRANGAVASGGSVQLTGGGFGLNGLANSLVVPIGLDGAFGVSGLPGGTYELLATLPAPQGTPLTAGRTALVVEGETRTADIAIAPTGGVGGTVRRANGGVAPGIPVQLRTSTLSRSTATDTGGRYAFSDIFTEFATVEAFDRTTNTAATGTVTVVADVVTPLDLSLTTGGTVSGTIRFGNTPAPGVQVTVQWTGGAVTTQSGSDGRYRVDHVTPGPVTVRASNASGIGGNAGTLGLSGETLTLDVALFAGGTVSGTVFRAGATPPQAVSGVEVSISRFVPGLPSTVTTNAQGQFSFEAVPVGTFSLTATDPATGDRGSATNQVNANGEQRIVNVTLNGQGRVVVTVRDASENVINRAHVVLYSQTQFGGSQAGDTAPDGTAIFERVLAGSFLVSATDPATQLAGSATDSVGVSGSKDVTVHLQPAGTVVGRVFAPDGITGVAGVTVRILTFYYGVQRQTTTANDGSYRLDAVPLGSYSVEALDAGGRLRARATGVELSSNGQIVTRNLTFVGLGRISGIVSNPNGSPAFNVGVSVRSTSSIGGFFTATTDSDGSYRVLSVPVGGFIATAQAQQLIGETTGQISQDGQEITANIQLRDNGITLPVYRYDGSNFYYNLRGDGSIGDSTNGVFGGDFSSNYGSFFLDLIRQDTPNRFTGGTIGTTEENGQEIAVRQQGLAGLDVTRKMFLPQGGYFTRFLEILSNQTSDPITVDVRVQDNLRAYYASPRIITTSSGDTGLSIADPNNPDRWVVMGDLYDYDPYVNGGVPETAFIFDGPNAAEHASAADFQQFGGSTFGQLQYRWNNVTIPPGGTVAYMHFGVQETSRAAAQAAAQRLVQLPPEALAGLNATEISEIRNFSVPIDGISALDPIALGGEVSGQAFEFDGTTPIPNIIVRFQSNNALYSRVQSLFTNSNGAFDIRQQIGCVGCGGNLIVPIEPFTLSANHPQTNVATGNITGSFTPGQTLAARDIRFIGTSIVSGTVRLAAGAATTNGGYVQMFRTSPSSLSLFVNLAGDGTFRVGGVPPGTYSEQVTAYHAQGTALTATRLLTVVANQNVSADVTLPPTGAVTGIVNDASGNPSANVFVDLRNNGYSFYRSLFTTSAGEFLFNDVPPGTYLLEASERNTGILSSANVVVSANQTTSQNLTLIGLGTLQIQVNLAGGGGAPSATVYVTEAARGTGLRFVGYTDGAGALTAANLAVGNFTVRAYHPSNQSLFTEVAGNMPSNGATVPIALTLPATGVISGQVTNALGTAGVANAFIEAYDSTLSTRFAYAYSDSNGNYTMTQVPAERALTLRAHSPINFSIYRQLTSQVIPADGATLTVNIAMLASAALRITVLKSDGTPFPNTRIDIRHSINNSFQFYGYTDNNGVLSALNIPEGVFTVLARDPSNFSARGSTPGQVQQSDDGQTLDVTVNAPLSGSITGTVYAGDGQATIPSTYVYVYDTDGSSFLSSTYTNQDGVYAINGIIPGGGGFTVRAYSPDGAIFTEATGTFSASGETRTIDLTLPLSVLRGRVSFDDGAPVQYPVVFGSWTDPSGQHTRNANLSNVDGSYLFIGLPVGDIVLTAQESSSGLNGTANGRIDSVATAVTLDVTLQPSGTVAGIVRNAQGAAVQGAIVVLISQGFNRYVTADTSGRYQFSHVVFGSVVLEACDFSVGSGVCANGTATLSGSSPTATVDIQLAGTGTLQGVVLDGSTPVPNASVRVASAGVSGPYTVQQYTVADTGGNYTFANVPAGSVRVTAQIDNRAGLADGTITADQTTTLDVPFGNTFLFGRLNLDGADLFRYDIQCDGSLNDGGTVSRNLNDAYDGSYYLTSPGRDAFFSCLGTGLLDINGRQVAIGPSAFLTMNVTRKIYVPQQGGFARYLEIVQNPTNVSRDVTLQVDGNLGSDSGMRVVVAPSSTNNHYAVTDQGGFCCDPALAHVFGGPDAAVSPIAVQFNNGNDNVFHRWTLTVPANGTVILMHFAVQRDYTDGGTAATTQAQALVDLSDAHALDGIGNAERSAIVNFRVPQQ